MAKDDKRGFQCPRCGHWDDDQVIDTRKIENAIQRTRRCKCGEITKTLERGEVTRLYVRKSHGDRESYSEDKLRRGLTLAFSNIRIESAAIDDIVQRVTEKARGMRREEISSHDIGNWVLEELKIRLREREDLYVVPFIRFSSIFRRLHYLHHIRDLVDEVERLLHPNSLNGTSSQLLQAERIS